jgi:SRSO17 transposase
MAYLPRGWLADAERCPAAGVPAQRVFATKPELARVMLEGALEAGVPAGWVTADEVYGADRRLRSWLETSGMAYVLAVKCTEPLLLPSGGPLAPGGPAGRVSRRRGAACCSARPARRRGGSAGCWPAAA